VADGVDSRAKLVGDLATYKREIFAAESPFYAALMDAMAADVEAGGPTWELLGPYADQPSTEYFPLRALAGVHRMVLDGSAPALRGHYPSVGGDGDAQAAWPGVRDAFAAHDPDVLDDLRHPLQTNETSRCGALAAGFHVIAKRDPTPMRAFELGASAGLNLHFDRYRYESGGLAAGPEDSPVRFVDYWRGGDPPFDAPVDLVERAGCDLDPIDPTTEAGRLSLLSYVMPDQLERIAMMRGALEVAAVDPVRVDRASADEWIANRLAAEPAAGVTTVVFHSVFWIYPPAAVTDAIRSTIEAAGARASDGSPLHWLRYEEGAERMGVVELRLRSWPGGTDELLARGGHHFQPLEWLG
jgi:hypothetical protein